MAEKHYMGTDSTFLRYSILTEKKLNILQVYSSIQCHVLYIKGIHIWWSELLPRVLVQVCFKCKKGSEKKDEGMKGNNVNGWVSRKEEGWEIWDAFVILIFLMEGTI